MFLPTTMGLWPTPGAHSVWGGWRKMLLILRGSIFLKGPSLLGAGGDPAFVRNVLPFPHSLVGRGAPGKSWLLKGQGSSWGESPMSHQKSGLYSVCRSLSPPPGGSGPPSSFGPVPVLVREVSSCQIQWVNSLFCFPWSHSSL